MFLQPSFLPRDFGPPQVEFVELDWLDHCDGAAQGGTGNALVREFPERPLDGPTKRNETVSKRKEKKPRILGKHTHTQGISHLQLGFFKSDPNPRLQICPRNTFWKQAATDGTKLDL